MSLISLLGFAFLKQAFSPVKRIVTDVKRITVNDLNLRIENLDSDDEIGELIATFNELISRLQRSFEQIKQFSLDVSHELKTPLTVLKGEIEVMLRQPREKHEYIETLKSLYEEAGKLQNIINDLFLLSQLESPEFKLRFTKVDLNEIILDTFEKKHYLAAEKQQTIELENVEQLFIKGEKNLLESLVSNLLENAIKYTPEKGKIKIYLDSQDKKAILGIIDNGRGIEPKYRDKIFDRFFRIDQSRTSETGGAGLGLAIAQRIAILHEAKIEIVNSDRNGSHFRVLFPLA